MHFCGIVNTHELAFLWIMYVHHHDLFVPFVSFNIMTSHHEWVY
jgi:hypothetical protein